MFQVTELKSWSIIFPRAAADDARAFYNAMEKVAQGMRFKIAKPDR